MIHDDPTKNSMYFDTTTLPRAQTIFAACWWGSILFLVVSLLAGCSVGNSATLLDDTTGSIQQSIFKGTTTKADVLRRYGKPDHEAVANGYEIWSYMSATNYGFSAKVKSLQIAFDSKGVVQDYRASSN